MNNTPTSPKLDLSNSSPICGLELERNGSYSTAINHEGVRKGLFIDPANSFCNSTDQTRIKIWNVAAGTVEYFEFGCILGLKDFWFALMELTDPSTRREVNSLFDGSI